MRTYNQLPKDQQQAAFNYHLNTMIEAVSILDNPPDAKPWANHDAIAENFTPIALQRAQTSLYGDDLGSGILPVIQRTDSPAELEKAFFQFEKEQENFTVALDNQTPCAIV